LGIVAFLIGAAISAISWEAFLSYYGKRIMTESRKIPEPTDSVLRQWARDFPRRIRNANRLMAIISFVTIIIIAVFIVTGVPLALTFALCVFCVGYFVWASARSGLLKRFMKERINNG
jgi:predicted PurR-regulated permease PerM